MKVALVSRAVFPLHGYGGLERHVAALEKYLRVEGCETTLYTTPPESGSTPEREGTIFVPYRGIPWPRRKGFAILDRDTNYLAWSVRAARRLLSDGRADIVQADGGAGFGYAFLAEAASAPFLLHPHGMEEFHAPTVKRALYFPLRSAVRFAARRAARVLAPDASMKDDVLSNLGIDERKVALVPNAIDLSEVDRNVRAVALEIPADGPLLLSVGRLESNKGFPILVRALSRIPGEFLWVLAGEGPERGSLEAEIERAGLGRRARVLGRVSEDELHALYERCDLFVHPTLYEGSSMVTLEAMAYQKAVVATRVGGIPDKIVEGENGLLVPPGDAEALAKSIAEALKDVERLRTWGARGRALVEARFSWSRRVKELLGLYQEVLRAKREPAPE
jgi:glycosyltransferase involved in cell wall biosynthesis